MAQHYLTGIPWNCVRVLNGWEVSEIITLPRDAVDPPDVLVRAFWMPPTLDVDIITHLDAMVDCLEDLAQQKPCPPQVQRMDPWVWILNSQRVGSPFLVYSLRRNHPSG